MPKLSSKPTVAGNLEAKFDAGEEVLDYFDLRTAKVVLPLNEASVKPGCRTATAQCQPAEQFKRALEIAAQIGKLERELSAILGNAEPVKNKTA